MLSRSDKLKRKKINKFLSFIVICVTLSILILPAFTLEKKDDDTNNNNGPTTVENVNEQGGAETSEDSTLEPVTNEDSVLTVAETIDDEYTVDDEEPVLLAEGATTTTTGFYLNDNQEKITDLKLTYKKDGNGVSVGSGGTVNSPDDKYLKLEVKYENINKTLLKDTYGKTIVYTLPEFFRLNKNVSAVIKDGTDAIGELIIQDGKAVITYYDDYLTTDTATTISTSFYVEGEIILTELNSEGKYDFTLGSNKISLDYGADYLEKYGDVKIAKKSSKPDKNSDYIKYEIEVTAGVDGCGSVYVVDKFTSKGEFFSYEGVTKSEAELSDVENNYNPFEKIENNDSATHGKIYKGNNDASTIPSSGASSIVEPGRLVWNIGSMAPNEKRTLTYYTKANEGQLLSGNQTTITNAANAYARKDENIYEKGSATNNFTANVFYNSNMRKNIISTTKKEDGSHEIKYRLNFKLDSSSNFPFKNFEFRDGLNYSGYETDSKIAKYIKYNNDYKVFKVDGSSSADVTDNTQILWSIDNTNYKSDLNEFGGVNPTRFIVKGKDGSPITIYPGDNYYIEYSITLGPEAFANMKTNSLTIKNRYLFDASNATKNGLGVVNQVYNDKPSITNSFVWNEKKLAETITSDRNVDISGTIFDLTSGTLQTGATVSSFIVPSGSYKYTVNVNKTDGLFDATDLTVSDVISPAQMEYVGYMKVIAHDYVNDVDEVKWVKIDGRTDFSLKIKDLGWTSGNYSFNFEYYAKPIDLHAIGELNVTNTFTLSGNITRGTDSFNFDSFGSSNTIRLTGDYRLDTTKRAWYYSESNTTDGPWKNGSIYWVIELSGTAIKQGTVIKDSISQHAGVTDSYIREDSLIGIYKGKIEDNYFDNNKNIDSFPKSSLEDLNTDEYFTKGLTNGKNFSETGCYSELVLTTKKIIDLGEDKLYIILKTEPQSLPANYRDAYLYKNHVNIKEPDGQDIEKAIAEFKLYRGGSILKELGQTFEYNNGTVKQITKDRDENDTSKIKTELLTDTGNGIYASWAVKVNYSGDLAGDYRVLEKIPSGMELAYIRLKWRGDNATNVVTQTIEGLDDSVWETMPKRNTVTDDYNQNRETIYYVSKDKRQALIKLSGFEAKHIQDHCSVDVQVVCKILDPKFLLGGESVEFINNVELQTGDGAKYEISKRDPSIAQNGTRFDKVSNLEKSGVKDEDNGQIINYTIVANPLAQKLPSNAPDGIGLVLVDEISNNLEIDPDSIKAFDGTTDITSEIKASFASGNTLMIKIPNEKKVTITYSATVKVAPNVQVTLTNKVYWDDYSQAGGKENKIENYSYSLAAGGSATSKPTLVIKKNDTNTLKPLSGVTFDLWKCSIVSNEIVQDTTSKQSAITESDGRLKFPSLDYDTIYEVKENKAPDGYIGDEKSHYIACVSNNYDDFVNQVNSYNTAHPDNPIEIKYGASNFSKQIYNTQKGILVQKLFKNAGGTNTKPISGTYLFGLYENKEGTGEPISKVSITYSVTDTEATKVTKFIDLDINKTYYVFELDRDNKPIIDVSNPHVINSMEYLTEYTTDKTGNIETNEAGVGNKVTVTNQVYTRQLPATGGNGINGYIKSGAMLMLLTGVLLLKRRR